MKYIVGGCMLDTVEEAEKFKAEMGFPDRVCNPPYHEWPRPDPAWKSVPFQEKVTKIISDERGSK